MNWTKVSPTGDVEAVDIAAAVVVKDGRGGRIVLNDGTQQEPAGLRDLLVKWRPEVRARFLAGYPSTSISMAAYMFANAMTEDARLMWWSTMLARIDLAPPPCPPLDPNVIQAWPLANALEEHLDKFTGLTNGWLVHVPTLPVPWFVPVGALADLEDDGVVVYVPQTPPIPPPAPPIPPPPTEPTATWTDLGTATSGTGHPAVAIVAMDGDLLLLCTRDGGPVGRTWSVQAQSLSLGFPLSADSVGGQVNAIYTTGGVVQMSLYAHGDVQDFDSVPKSLQRRGTPIKGTDTNGRSVRARSVFPAVGGLIYTCGALTPTKGSTGAAGGYASVCEGGVQSILFLSTPVIIGGGMIGGAPRFVTALGTILDASGAVLYDTGMTALRRALVTETSIHIAVGAHTLETVAEGYRVSETPGAIHSVATFGDAGAREWPLPNGYTWPLRGVGLELMPLFEGPGSVYALLTVDHGILDADYSLWRVSDTSLIHVIDLGAWQMLVACRFGDKIAALAVKDGGHHLGIVEC